MKEEIKGLILKEQTVGEKDRLVTVLTNDRGVIRCFVRGAKVMTNKRFSATQPFCYSRLNLFVKKDSSVIDDAERIQFFYKLRYDLEKLALAQYFCELVIHVIQPGASSESALNLLLNCLHILTESSKPPELIKSVFELRLMAINGFIPNILFCSGCGCYEDERMFFSPSQGSLTCSSCVKREEEAPPDLIGMSPGALTAFRYIEVAEDKKIFSFKASQQSLSEVASCAQKYVLSVCHRDFSSLKFYQSIKT